MRHLRMPALLLASFWSATLVAAELTKTLVVPGEVFAVDGKTAFVFTPAADAVPKGPKPWILYGPTLPAYPDEAEKWMHERFTAAGVAVAGIDTGESYGSPVGVKAMEALHAEMVRRGYATKPAFLGQFVGDRPSGVHRGGRRHLSRVRLADLSRDRQRGAGLRTLRG